MINVYIAGGSPGGAVVGALPCPRCGSAGRVLDDIGSVSCKNEFAGVAGAYSC